MKNTHITIIVLVVLLAVGAWFMFGNKKAEAPIESPQTGTTTNNNPSGPDYTPPQDTQLPPPETHVPVTVDMNTTVKTGAVKVFTVEAQNFSFTPATMTVKKGDKVKITFKNTAGFHDFKIDEFGVASTQTQGPSSQVLEFTADKTGSFQYYCSVGTHRAMGMWGTLTVQ